MDIHKLKPWRGWPAFLRLLAACLWLCCAAGAARAAEIDPDDVCWGGFISPAARLAACDAVLGRAKMKGTIAFANAARGAALIALRRYDEAELAYTAALDYDPNEITFLGGRAEALDHLGRWQPAARDFEAALRQKPHGAEQALQQAKILGHLNRPDEAIEKYAAVLAEKPKIQITLRDAYHLRGVLYLQKARQDERQSDAFAALALSDFNAALAIIPFPDGFYFRSLAYEQSRRYREAIADVTQALTFQPDNPVLLNAKCWDEAEANVDLELALSECDRALAKATPKDPGRANWLDSRGFVHFRLGRWADAVADYDAALAVDPKMAASLYVRGVAKRRLGERSGGDADIAAAARLDPRTGERLAAVGVTP